MPAGTDTSAAVLTLLVALALFACPIEVASAQDYPTRPVRIVVPGAPGGINDLVARMMAPDLAARLGRPVVVENRAGAGTILGNDLVAKSPADGHTLLMCVVAFAISPATYRKVPYDVVRDFAPITQAVSASNMLVVHPSIPARSVRELVALAKARPGEILFSSSGHGTNAHLAMELFANLAQIRMLHVPYKGGPPAVVAVIAGHVATTAISISSVLPHVRTGRLRALAVTGERRVPSAPELPTIAEAGVPRYESSQWSGLLAPAGTSPAIVARLHQESTAVLRAAEHRERLAADGVEVIASSPEAFGGFIRSETAKWARVVKAAGIQPE